MAQAMNTQPLALIVEDDYEQGSIFQEALRLAEFETELIRDGSSAITRLNETQPNVVILDLHLPLVSGKEILHHIRADRRLSNTRVVLATADPGTADMIEQEADLVLIKPISFIQLRDLAVRLRPPDIVG